MLYIAIDLRFVHSKPKNPDAIVSGPGGRQFGVWKIEGDKIKFAIQHLNGARITPIKRPPEEKPEYPGDDHGKWEYAEWLADLGKIHDGRLERMDEGHFRGNLELDYGHFGAVMPADPNIRDKKFVVLDEGDNEVKSGGKHRINQPLSNALLYKATIDGEFALLKLQDLSIKLKGMSQVEASSLGAPVFLSHLPDPSRFDPNAAPKKRLDHFRHYNNVIRFVKKHSPGLDPNPVRDYVPGFPKLPTRPMHIEPIYCPPAFMQEA